VSPRIAIGFFLNPFINIFFMRFGNEEYNVNPASPLRLIKVLPVLLYLEINSSEVSRCFILRMLERLVMVRGIDHSFFLEAAKPFLNLSEVFFQTEIY
jgi:hypothetical protein